MRKRRREEKREEYRGPHVGAPKLAAVEVSDETVVPINAAAVKEEKEGAEIEDLRETPVEAAWVASRSKVQRM